MTVTEEHRPYQVPRGCRSWFTAPWATTRAARSIVLGAAIGLALPALVATTLWATAVIDLSRSGETVSALLTTFITAVLLTPLLEEVVFRYLLFRGLEQFLGSWTGLGVTGVLFGAAHLTFSSPDSVVQGVLIATAGTLAGIFFTAGYLVTRTLWLPIGLHAGWNAVTNFLIGPDRLDAHRVLWLNPGDRMVLSGGDFGTDASILTSAVLLAASVALLRNARRKENLVPRKTAAGKRAS
jgi:uncharacterized protein